MSGARVGLGGLQRRSQEYGKDFVDGLRKLFHGVVLVVMAEPVGYQLDFGTRRRLGTWSSPCTPRPRFGRYSAIRLAVTVAFVIQGFQLRRSGVSPRAQLEPMPG